jgi:glutathione S-transferase
LAKHLGLDVDYVRVDLAKGKSRMPEYLAINPNGKAPALIDGEVQLWESHAIMAYMAHIAGSDMWPSNPMEQIDTRDGSHGIRRTFPGMWGPFCSRILSNPPFKVAPLTRQKMRNQQAICANSAAS